MADHDSSTRRPSRRTALKALGVATGGTALTATGTANSAGATPVSHDRIPGDLKPGGALDRYAAGLASKDEFSGSLLVSHRGRPVLSRSHRMANKETGVRNRPETRFGLASVTKMFTATAIHQLAEQGRLNYHDELGAHLDGFPAKIADAVTIHHLLTHSSGFGDFHNLPAFREESRKWESAEEVLDGTVEIIRGTDPEFAPGAGNLYSNSAFCLLGAIVGAASGRTFYDYMADHVFKAAGMGDSGFFTKDQWRADPSIARPYYREPGSSGWTDSIEEHIHIGLPPGGAFATCADMGRYARALLDGKLMGAPYVDIMLGGKLPQAPQKPPPDGAGPHPTSFIGYGPLAVLEHGQWVHGHGGGGSFGASTNIDIFPGSGWVVVVLSNYPPRTAEPIARKARRLILER